MKNKRFIALLPAALLFGTSLASGQPAGGVDVASLVALAEQNDVAVPRAFWRSDDGEWLGVAGIGADGTWYEIVVDKSGALVRTKHDDGVATPVSLTDALGIATDNGIAKLTALRLGGDTWFAMGDDAAGAPLWLVIDAATGKVVKKGPA